MAELQHPLLHVYLLVLEEQNYWQSYNTPYLKSIYRS